MVTNTDLYKSCRKHCTQSSYWHRPGLVSGRQSQDEHSKLLSLLQMYFIFPQISALSKTFFAEGTHLSTHFDFLNLCTQKRKLAHPVSGFWS